MNTYKRMGEFLLAKGLIDQNQLERAIEARDRSHLRFGEILVVLGYVEEAAVTACLAEQYHLSVADLSTLEPTTEALGIVSSLFAVTRHFLPIAVTGDVVFAVIGDPIDLELTDKIIRETGRRLSLALASPRELSQAIAKAYELPYASYTEESHSDAKGKTGTKHRKKDDASDRRALLDSLALFCEPVYAGSAGR